MENCIIFVAVSPKIGIIQKKSTKTTTTKTTKQKTRQQKTTNKQKNPQCI